MSDKMRWPVPQFQGHFQLSASQISPNQTFLHERDSTVQTQKKYYWSEFKSTTLVSNQGY